MSQLSTPPPPTTAEPQAEHWTARHGKPIIFVILTLIAVGVYLALTIPVAVFPETNFPRIVVGVDNGVAPIDQMMVTVTRPLEEAVNTVEGLERVWSITSRGPLKSTFSSRGKWICSGRSSWSMPPWPALSPPCLPPLRSPPTGLTFAAFPIMGYSLTSDKFPQTRLWEIATYEIKPRLNRMNGVSTVVVQGGLEPEFEVKPDPAKLIETAMTIPNILDAIGRSNLIDSPGLIENNHQLVLSLVSGQARTPAEIANIVVKTTPAGAPIHIGDVASVAPSTKPVYTIVTANQKPAVLLNIYRQPIGNTVTVADAVHAEIDRVRKGLPRGVELRPFYDQSELVNGSIKSVRDAILIGLVLASLIMVLFLRDWGTSLVAGLVIPATIAVTFIALRVLGESFQPDDTGRPGGGRRSGNRRRHRGGRKHRHAPRFRAIARRGDPQRPPGNTGAAGWLDHNAYRGVPAVDFHHRSNGSLLSRARDHGGHGSAHFARPGAHLDAHAQPLFHPPARNTCGGA